jgi:primosomal protein N' (replication factor Y) (superfamily II helicase)
VAAVNPDAALFGSDFRAPQRLFALLMQADAAQSHASEMWVQSWNPRHPLYEALRPHDYEAFAAAQLAERQGAGPPPFSSLALVQAEAREAAAALANLKDALALMPGDAGVVGQFPVPQRGELPAAHKGVLRWAVDVDPLAI